MGHLWDLIEEWQDANGHPSIASLARQMGISDKVLGAWKTRGVKALPEPKTLRRLAERIGQPYEVVLAAAEADAGYRTDPELVEVLDGRGISEETKARLRAHLSEPLGDNRGKAALREAT